MTSAPFGAMIRLAAVHGHRLLFDRSAGNAVFDLTDAGLVVDLGPANLAPKLTIDMPKRTEAILLTFKKRSFATETLRFADTVRLLGLVLPPVALVLFALAIAIAPERRTRDHAQRGGRRGWRRCSSHSRSSWRVATPSPTCRGPAELSAPTCGRRSNDLWGVFLGDLMTWTLVVTAVALIVAAASASVLDGVLARRRASSACVRCTAAPVDATGRAGRAGAVVLAVGLLALVDPTLVLRVLVLVGGVPADLRRRRRAADRRGSRASLGRAVARRVPPAGRGRRRRRGAVCAAVVGLAFAFTGATSSVTARSLRACNGYPAALRPPSRRGRVRRARTTRCRPPTRRGG